MCQWIRRAPCWSGRVRRHSGATLRTVQAPAPLAYTPPYLAEKILTSRSALEGERKQVTVLFADLKGSTELIRGLDPEAARPAPGPGSARHDGRRAPLRGHGEPGARRRHYGPVRGPAGPRRPRRARLLCRPGHAGRPAPLCRRGAPHPRPGGADARRAQLRRSGGAGHWQRPAHGLLRRRPDHGPGGAHGATRHTRQHAAHRRHPAAGGRHGPGQPPGTRAGQGGGRARGGL